MAQTIVCASDGDRLSLLLSERKKEDVPSCGDDVESTSPVAKILVDMSC